MVEEEQKEKDEDKSQPQGPLPPHPRKEEKDRCAGGEVIAGAEPVLTLAVPQVPPQRPHLLGRARPLWHLYPGGFMAGRRAFYFQ